MMRTASSSKAVVVSGHRDATKAALDILRDDGNIVDAAIAGAAMLCATLPHACGLGGDCFILIHRDGQTYSINGSGRSPLALPDKVTSQELAGGPLSCGVPGMVGGWEALHTTFGNKPWKELFGAAISAARDGCSPGGDLERALKSNSVRLAADPGCNELFIFSDPVARVGMPLRQPALSVTLELIAAQGSQVLYRGDVGQSLCQAVAARGGVLSLQDLADYEPLWVKPLRYPYRDLEVCVPPPNSYALLLPLQLEALSRTAIESDGIQSAERVWKLISAARRAFDAGSSLLGDPLHITAPTDGNLPASLIEQLETASAHSDIFASMPPSQGTALISVADDNGDGVTIIQSIFTPFGACVADAATGIVLNNRLLGFSQDPTSVNCAAPGKRPAHTLSPAMVFKDGMLRLLLATPGGSGQTITLTQVLSNMVNHHLSLSEAIAFPRWSMDLQGNLLAEGGISTQEVSRLDAMRLPIRHPTPDQHFFFGSAECIGVAEDMHLTAVADTRRDAYAEGL